MNDHFGIAGVVLAFLGSVLAATHPWAAAGAGFGCCFFLASPNSTNGKQRLFLGAFSWGIGYAAGVFWFGDGPPWSPKAMLISAAVSALAAVIFTAWFGVIANNGTLPPWLSSLLELLPFRKGGRDGDL